MFAIENFGNQSFTTSSGHFQPILVEPIDTKQRTIVQLSTKKNIIFSFLKPFFWKLFWMSNLIAGVIEDRKPFSCT